MPKLRKRKMTHTADGMSLAEARKTDKLVDTQCFFCDNWEKAPKNTKAILCSRCVITLAGPSALPASVIREKEKAANPNAPPKRRGRPKGSKNKSGEKSELVVKARRKRAPNGQGKKYVPSGKPRGWHLKKIWTDPKTGLTYRFGIQQPLNTKQVKVVDKVLKKAARKFVKKSTRGRGRPKGSKNKKKSRRSR